MLNPKKLPSVLHLAVVLVALCFVTNWFEAVFVVAVLGGGGFAYRRMIPKVTEIPVSLWMWGLVSIGLLVGLAAAVFPVLEMPRVFSQALWGLWFVLVLISARWFRLFLLNVATTVFASSIWLYGAKSVTVGGFYLGLNGNVITAVFLGSMVLIWAFWRSSNRTPYLAEVILVLSLMIALPSFARYKLRVHRYSGMRLAMPAHVGSTNIVQTQPNQLTIFGYHGRAAFELSEYPGNGFGFGSSHPTPVILDIKLRSGDRFTVKYADRRSISVCSRWRGSNVYGADKIETRTFKVCRSDGECPIETGVTNVFAKPDDVTNPLILENWDGQQYDRAEAEHARRTVKRAKAVTEQSGTFDAEIKQR